MERVEQKPPAFSCACVERSRDGRVRTMARDRQHTVLVRCHYPEMAHQRPMVSRSWRSLHLA
jgi:hypothetical protein